MKRRLSMSCLICEEVDVHVNPACKALHLEQDEVIRALGDGLYAIYDDHQDGYVAAWLTDDQKRLLEMLAGPHGKTIYAAIKARRGITCQDIPTPNQT
jgi:hypothetical protein